MEQGQSGFLLLRLKLDPNVGRLMQPAFNNMYLNPLKGKPCSRYHVPGSPSPTPSSFRIQRRACVQIAQIEPTTIIMIVLKTNSVIVNPKKKKTNLTILCSTIKKKKIYIYIYK